MKDIILEFLEWVPDNLESWDELLDEEAEITVDKYIKSLDDD